MKILVNLIPPTSGGGLQNALSFLYQLAETPFFLEDVLVVCPRYQAVHKACEALGIKYITIKSSYLARFWFEMIGGYLISRRYSISIIFSLFGNAPIFSPGLYKISGLAFSNVLQPEIPFWNFLPPLKRLKQEFKDRLRVWSIRRSQEIIVETHYLADRARTGIFSDKTVHVVQMEASALVLEALRATKAKLRTRNEMHLLILAGPHPNKRIEAMAPIMAALSDLRTKVGLSPPLLLISIENEHPYARKIKSEFDKFGASKCLSLIGHVPQAEVGEVLCQVDGVVNIARLESFSNNWVEAWAAGLPLVSTDADWARSSCGDAAIYINPMEPDQAAQKIFDAYSSFDALSSLVLCGHAKLKELSQNGRKIDSYYKIIKCACEEI